MTAEEWALSLHVKKVGRICWMQMAKEVRPEFRERWLNAKAALTGDETLAACCEEARRRSWVVTVRPAELTDRDIEQLQSFDDMKKQQRSCVFSSAGVHSWLKRNTKAPDCSTRSVELTDTRWRSHRNTIT